MIIMMIKNDDVTPDEQVVCCMGASATPVCVCVCVCVCVNVFLVKPEKVLAYK